MNDVARYLPRRAGSALILTVMLVVLLALIGTAFMATARTDRYSAQINAENVQVDLYVDGVVNIAKSLIVNDLFDVGGWDNGKHYRPCGFGNYRHYIDITSSYSHGWMASRVPEPRVRDEYERPREFDKYVWPFMSLPPHIDDEGKNSFTSPAHPKDYQNWYYRVGVYNPPLSLEVNGVEYPGVALYLSNGYRQLVAADADGDGIADSGLWPVSKQSRDGITYFAGLRIIDNCAAINVNTAWLRDYDLAANNQRVPNTAFYPSNVGLQEFLLSPAEMDRINALRFAGGGLSLAPIGENGQPRSDFVFATQAEALYWGLGARLGNPGFSAAGRRFHPFGTQDAISLAYRFCMVNLEVAPSQLEQAAEQSLYRSAGNYQTGFLYYQRPKNPDGTYREDFKDLLERWWADNWDYERGRFSRRALTVTSNSVSNAVCIPRRDLDGDGAVEEPGHIGMLPFVSQGEWTSGREYEVHQLVRYRKHHYVCIATGNAGQAPTGTTESNAYWEYQPWSATPVKSSLNTATFRDLWRSFWGVMVTNGDGTSGSNPTTLPSQGGRMLAMPPLRDSSVYDGTDTVKPAPLAVTEVTNLRAALAAVNTLDLRDQDQDITSRLITLYQPPSGSGRYNELANPRYQVMVYGNERQPFITEVVLDTSRQRGYIALELHNPYPDPIAVPNWKLARLKRDRGLSAGMQVQEVADLQQIGLAEIPAGGYVVIESHDAAQRPEDLTKDFAARNITPLHAPKLGANAEGDDREGGFGHEVVLLRPRRADGTLTRSTRADNRYDEGTTANPRLAEFVPLDQIDLTGIDPFQEYNRMEGAKPRDEFMVAMRYHYRRASGPGHLFEFVYPGPYTTVPQDTTDNGVTEISRHRGMKWEKPPGPDSEGNLPKYDPNPGHLGAADSSASYRPTTVIQLSNVDVPGYNPLSNRDNRYPFGMFARVGDVLHVPFIGAYTFYPLSGERERVVEMNAVTMDTLFATSTDTNKLDETKNAFLTENVGRFCPQGDYIDYASKGYSWAFNILEFFTTHSPHEDYLPNVRPDLYGYYDNSGNFRKLPAPDPIANNDPTTPNIDEGQVGQQGLINVNTAPWIVLAQLPLVLNSDGSVNHPATVACAKEIARVNHNGRRPAFKTLLEVNYILKQFSPIPAEADDADGDFSPRGQGITDGITGEWEYEQRFAPIIRLSNLLTVRSDSFTVYIVVEGWRDAHDPTRARRVLQRRVAFFADRSAINEQNRTLKIVNIPTN